MDGSDPVGDAFSTLPFPPEAISDFATLLNSMPGIRVTNDYDVTGSVIQVGEVCTDAEGCQMKVMVLQDDGKVTNLTIGNGQSLRIVDQSIVDGLIDGIRATNADAAGTARGISIILDGTDMKNGMLSYVISAPAWKTSYRAIAGENDAVDLQGWAIIENATGEDWDDVSLTLSSGSPVTLTADLFGRDWRQREDVSQMSAKANDFAQEMESGFAPQAAFRGMADSMELSAVAAAPAKLSSGTTVSDSAIDSRFALPGAHDVPAGKILSTPFLTQSLDAERLARWQGSLSHRVGSPQLILQVENDMPVRLPSGIVTMTDPDTGYVGDAHMPVVAPGETVDVTYGTDRHIEITEATSSSRLRQSIKIAKGMIRIEGIERRDTVYDIVSHDGAAREVTIDHPDYDDWSISAEGVEPSEHKGDNGQVWARFAVTTPSGEGPSKSILKVSESRPTMEMVAFGNLNTDEFLSWMGAVESAEDKAFLRRAADLTAKISELHAAMDQSRAMLSQLENDQQRTRANLSAAASGSDAHNRFMTTLMALEDQITAGRAAQQVTQNALNEAQSDLADHLALGN
jgi:hypothetical protein